MTRVWITRARPEAEATAARLQALGWAPLVAPLLEIRPLPAPLELEGVGALAFTSRNGVRAFAARTDRRDLPAYTVGAATAALAREAGFTDVRAAEGPMGGDVGALARLIAADTARPEGALLHIAPRDPAGDLAGALARAGLTARTAALYEAAPLPPSPEAIDAWPRLAAVLLHSPKAARVLAEAGPRPPGPPLLCLSEAVAAPLRPLHPEVRVASEPTEDALLALLGKPPPAR